MADLSIVVTQEAAKVVDTPSAPTRFYFPSAGASDLSPAFDAAWTSTAAAVRRKLPLPGEHRTTAMASVTITSTAANPEKHLHAQYVSPPLRAQTLSGNLRGQFRALESAAGLNATLQIGVRVVSADGGTVRATLLAVGGSTTTATTPPELTTSLTNRRLLTAGDVTPLGLSSYTCADGDRLVIEIGINDKSTSTSQTAQISFGDDSTDLPENDTTTTAQNPWVEFDSTIRFATQVETAKVSDGGVAERMDRGWVRLDDSSLTAALVGGLAANVTAENVKVADTVTVARDLTASVTDALVVADTLTALIVLLATRTESVRVLEQADQSLDPERAGPAESLVLADTLTALLVLLVNLQEVLKQADGGAAAQRGIVQLIGVIHAADEIDAALVAGGGLATAVADEVAHLQELVVASRGLTASVSDSLIVADSVTAARDLTATPTEAVAIADAANGTLDPEQVSATDSLKLADAVTATFNVSASLADEGLRLAEGAPVGRLDPLQLVVPADAVRLLDSDLTPARTLEVTVSSEVLALADAPVGQITSAGVAGPETLRLADAVTAQLALLEAAAPLGETTHVTDAAVGAFLPQLAATVGSEGLKLSDRVVSLSANVNETVRLSDAGIGRATLLGVVHIVDGPVLAQVGGFQSAAATEALTLADTVAAVRTPLEALLQEIAKIGDADSSAVEYTQDEFLELTEVLFVTLAAPTDLSTATTESLRLGETVATARTLEVLVAGDGLKVGDALTAARDLTASVTETGALADSLTAARDLTSSLTEATPLADLTPVGRLDPLEPPTAATESCRLFETVAATVGNPADLSFGVSADALVLRETMLVSRDLTATLSEAVTLSEGFDIGFGQPLTATVANESLAVGDALTVQAGTLLAPVDSDDLLLSDPIEATLALAVVVLADDLNIGDGYLSLGLDLSVEIPGLPFPLPETHGGRAFRIPRRTSEFVIPARVHEWRVHPIKEQQPMVATVPQDPLAILEWTLDWTDWLDGDLISAASFVVTPANEIQIGDGTHVNAFTTKKTTFWAITANGVLGRRYVVRTYVETTSGRHDDRRLTIVVREQ